MTGKRNNNKKFKVGREIFLAQLKLMQEYGKTADLLDDEEAARLGLVVRAFAVPEELLEAFYAYYMEFLSEPGGCTSISGAFFNDEDVKGGVWSKFWHFYKPMVNMVAAKYPELQFSISIDPSFDDVTRIISVAENKSGYDVIPVPVAVLDESWKAWHVPFDGPEDPEGVYAELEEIYEEIDGRVRRANAVHYVIVQLEKGVLADTWICHDEREAVTLAGKIAGDRCRDEDDDVLVELSASTDIHDHSTRVWSWGGGEVENEANE